MSEKNEKQKQSITSPSPSMMDRLTNPTTTAPSRGAKKLANKMDAPSMGSTMFNPNSMMGRAENTGNVMNAMVRGGLAGMTQGVGDVLSDFTSPISIIGALAGNLPISKAVQGASKISKITKPTIDVVENIPVKQVAPAMDDVGSLIGDLQRNLAKIPTSKKLATGITSPAMPAEMIPRGGEAAYNATRSIATPTKSVNDSILDIMANRRKYATGAR